MEPTNSIDAIIEIYQRDVDVTLLDENLRLTVDQRLRKLQAFSAAVDELREGMSEAIEKSE